MTITTEILQDDSVTLQVQVYNRKDDGAILPRPLEGSSLLLGSCRASCVNLHTIELILITAKLRFGRSNTWISITLNWGFATGFEFATEWSLEYFFYQLPC